MVTEHSFNIALAKEVGIDPSTGSGTEVIVKDNW